MKKRKMKVIYRFVIFVFLLFFKIFYHFKISGKKNFKHGKAIIAVNHVSFLDPPAIAAACDEEVHFLAKESLFKHAIFAFFLRLLNSHPLSSKPSDITTFREVEKILKENKKIVLFPEGTRSYSGKINKIMPGIGFIAYRSKCRIIPAYIDGVYDVWPRNKKFPKLKGKIKCVFGEPIEVEKFAHKSRKEAVDWISNAIKESLEKLERENKNNK